MPEGELIEKFEIDLNEICQDLVDNFHLKYKKEVQRLADPVLRWADFRLRYIDPRPRTILASSKFPGCIPPEAVPGFEKFVAEAISGSDLNIYQGKGLSEWNDVSGEKPRVRTDLLWADWGILHFHLSSSPPRVNEYYVPRSDWYLFAVQTKSELGFIDIRPHNEGNIFEDKKLVEEAVRCWPDYFSRNKLNGVLLNESFLSRGDIKKLRRAGVLVPIAVEGSAYSPPGGGLTTASIPSKVIMKVDQIKKQVRQLAKIFADPKGQIQSDLSEKEIKSPRFCLGLSPRGLGVLEDNSNVCFLLPKDNQDFHDLQDFLAPEWVCTRLSDNSLNTE